MRCFLAIDIPQPIKLELEGVIARARKLGLTASFVKTPQLHVTLYFLGERSSPQADAIQAKLASLDFPQFTVSIEGAGFFPNPYNPRVFWAGAVTANGKLKDLQAVVCSLIGERPERDFTGHVTLARIKGPQNVSALRALGESLSGRKFGEFTAGAVVFKRSLLSADGAAHEDLNTFPLK